MIKVININIDGLFKVIQKLRWQSQWSLFFIIISELLALARFDSGQVASALKLEWCDICQVANHVLKSLGKLAKEKNIILQLSALQRYRYLASGMNSLS